MKLLSLDIIRILSLISIDPSLLLTFLLTPTNLFNDTHIQKALKEVKQHALPR